MAIAIVVRRAAVQAFRAGRAGLALLAAAALAASAGPLPGAPRASAQATSPGVIITLAGGIGGDGPATRLALGRVCGVAFGPGVIYAAQPAVIRVISTSTGRLTTLAGTGVAGYSPDGIAATTASLAEPCGMAAGQAGNLLLADTLSNRIRVVAAQTGTFYGQAMTAGDIYTIAGTGSPGYSGDGGPATSAELHAPSGVAVDAAGNVLTADKQNNRIRVVAAQTGTFYGQAMTAGDIYTIAGDGTQGDSGDGGPAASAGLRFPDGVALDPAGDVIVADEGNERVRLVAAATGTAFGQPVTAGSIYTIAGDGDTGSSGDGGPGPAAEADPQAVATDPAGDVLISDSYNSTVRVVAAQTGTFYGQAMTAGDIYTIAGNGNQGYAGDGGPATQAEFWAVTGVAADSAGNIALADRTGNRVRVIAAATGRYCGQAMTAGDIYTVAGNGFYGYSGDGRPATAAQLEFFSGLRFGPGGSLVIADTDNGRIRMVAGTTGTFFGQSMTAGSIYRVAGTVPGFGGDGGKATSARLLLPAGVGVDGAGNLLIADTANGRIRLVAAVAGTFYGKPRRAGRIYTIAGNGGAGYSGDGGPAVRASLSGPTGVAADHAGNLLIADRLANRIRVVAAAAGRFYGRTMKAGHIYPVAGDGFPGYSGDGGPAVKARLQAPAQLAVDAAGNVIIADTFSQRVRVVAAITGTFYGQAMKAGHIYTVAGDGTPGFSGDGGAATGAELSFPADVAVDRAGNLLVADAGNDRVRAVAVRTGSFYGVDMTAGGIYTIAGTGSPGYSGDGGPATSARLIGPSAVAAGPGGEVAIGDAMSVRAVAGG